MNIRRMFFRDQQQTGVDVVECWEVRWRSRHGGFSSDTRPEVRVFTSYEEAREFECALQDAFALLKHTSGTRVTLEKQG